MGNTVAIDTSSLQGRLRSTDEEWKVLGPKLDAFLQAKQATTPDLNDQGDAFGFGGRGLPQSSDTFGGPNEVPAQGNFRGGGGGALGPLGMVIGNIFAGTSPPAKATTQPAASTDPVDPASSANSGTSRQSVTLAQALTDLQSAIKDKHTTDKQLADQLITVRAARQKAQADFKTAQDALRQLITPDQEAVLVSMGYMD